MPAMNSWKVFYERIKQGAYQTDSTKGTTPIYQEIKNLSAAKSAYGNIVYNKAPAFLRQAEFYLGEEKFQNAVRSFLKKHEFGNAGWEDLILEFSLATDGLVVNQKVMKMSLQDRQYILKDWSTKWVTKPGLSKYYVSANQVHLSYPHPGMPTLSYLVSHKTLADDYLFRNQRFQILLRLKAQEPKVHDFYFGGGGGSVDGSISYPLILDNEQGLTDVDQPQFIFPNYQDYGYGIFFFDEKGRDYVLKNIQNEKDPFLRSMMWGSLWDSVREGELDPREYVELVVRVLSKSDGFSRSSPPQGTPKGVTLTSDDESTVASLLGRVGTAMNYYMSEPRAVATGPSSTSTAKSPVATAQGTDLQARLENLLIDRMRNAETAGQRITFYRAFLNVAQSDNARGVLKAMLKGGNPSGSEGASPDVRSAAGSTTPAAKPATPPIQEGS